MPVIIKRAAATTREVVVKFRHPWGEESRFLLKAYCAAPIKDGALTTQDVAIVKVTTLDGEVVPLILDGDIEYDIACTAWFILVGESVLS